MRLTSDIRNNDCSAVTRGLASNDLYGRLSVEKSADVTPITTASMNVRSCGGGTEGPQHTVCLIGINIRILHRRTPRFAECAQPSFTGLFIDDNRETHTFAFTVAAIHTARSRL